MKRTTSGCLRTGVMLFVAIIAASAAGSAAIPSAHHAGTSGGNHLTVFGGRSATQVRNGIGGKLDAALADLSRHMDRVRPGHELEDLHALNPAARFTRSAAGAPMVLIDAVTRGDPRQLKQTLVGLGLQRAALYSNDVGGWLPLAAITSAAARAEVLSMRAAMPRTRAAVLATQGDFAQGTSALRATFPTLTGSGVTVGILSDSFNCYDVYEQPGSGVPASGANGYAPFGFASDNASFDESNGYLTASVNVLEEAPCLEYGQPYELPFADEGRAMLQVVHAVAPAAALAFYTASNSEADFANGIGALATAGAKVIADDTVYFDEPFFQDGIVAQSIEAVAAKGVAYFSAAGNDGDNSYDNTAPQFTTAGTGSLVGQNLLNFDASGASTTTSLAVTIPELGPGEFIGLILEWDQPYVTGAPDSPGASSRLNLCVSGASEYTVFDLDGNFVSCTGANGTGTDPVQVLILGNPANATSISPSTTVNLQVGLVNGSPVPGRIKLVVADDGAGSTIDAFATHSATLQGHPGAAGAAAVAAAYFALTPLCGTSPALLENFSAKGGEPILFSTSGTRLTTPQLRQKPDFTGPDGINTSFFGAPLADYSSPDNSDTSSVAACQDDVSFNNFFGTSAATPHAAGAAALLLQAMPTLTPALLIGALHATAEPMSGTTPNFESGYGFIQAAALSSPAIWFPGNTVSVGNTTTLSWVALSASSCTASGGWSGTQASSGSQKVTPSAVGNLSYTLTCLSTAGSKSSSVTLQAVPTLAITSSALPKGQVGTAYAATLTATGGVTPYSWSLANSTLPAGLSLNASTGAISGVPTSAVSASTLVLQVTDSEQPSFSKTQSLSLTIAAAPPAPSSGGGGGGALGLVMLLALTAVAAARVLCAQRRRGMRSA
jgi:subtilisin family serine protease